MNSFFNGENTNDWIWTPLASRSSFYLSLYSDDAVYEDDPRWTCHPLLSSDKISHGSSIKDLQKKILPSSKSITFEESMAVRIVAISRLNIYGHPQEKDSERRKCMMASYPVQCLVVMADVNGELVQGVLWNDFCLSTYFHLSVDDIILISNFKIRRASPESTPNTHLEVSFNSSNPSSSIKTLTDKQREAVVSLGMMSVSFDGLVESGKIPPFYYCIEGVVLFASNIHRERASDGLKYIEYRWITLLPEQTSGDESPCECLVKVYTCSHPKDLKSIKSSSKSFLRVSFVRPYFNDHSSLRQRLSTISGQIFVTTYLSRFDFIEPEDEDEQQKDEDGPPGLISVNGGILPTPCVTSASHGASLYPVNVIYSIEDVCSLIEELQVNETRSVILRNVQIGRVIADQILHHPLRRALSAGNIFKLVTRRSKRIHARDDVVSSRDDNERGQGFSGESSDVLYLTSRSPISVDISFEDDQSSLFPLPAFPVILSEGFDATHSDRRSLAVYFLSSFDGIQLSTMTGEEDLFNALTANLINKLKVLVDPQKDGHIYGDAFDLEDMLDVTARIKGANVDVELMLVKKLHVSDKTPQIMIDVYAIVSNIYPINKDS